MKIKICGLSRPEDIEAVNRCRPDYIGFVFAPSRRQVTAKTARKLKERLRQDISVIGVFVNAPQAEIIALADSGAIDLIQLHGDESADYLYALKERVPLPVIGALRFREAGEILAAQTLPYEYLLLDAYRNGSYGGTGETFDWNAIPPLEKPFFLSGGLTPENLPRAMKQGAYCLDVSSGAETDGHKDPEKIKAIVEMVRRERS